MEAATRTSIQALDSVPQHIRLRPARPCGRGGGRGGTWTVATPNMGANSCWLGATCRGARSVTRPPRPSRRQHRRRRRDAAAVRRCGREKLGLLACYGGGEGDFILHGMVGEDARSQSARPARVTAAFRTAAGAQLGRGARHGGAPCRGGTSRWRVRRGMPRRKHSAWISCMQRITCGPTGAM